MLVLSLLTSPSYIMQQFVPSAVGRTGTFICIDILLDYLYAMLHQAHVDSNSIVVNVCQVVQHLRRSRVGMVQSKSQYKFIYLYLDYCISKKLFIQ